MQGPRCNACVRKCQLLLTPCPLRLGRRECQELPRKAAAFSQESQGTIVRMSEPKGHPVPVGKLGPKKAETSPKPPRWSVAESGQEPRPPVPRALLIPLQHMCPQSPSGQGTSFVHLCNRGEKGGSWETGCAVHSANSFHGSLAPGQGPGLVVSGCQCHWQRKIKHPKASQGKGLILEWPGIVTRKQGWKTSLSSLSSQTPPRGLHPSPQTSQHPWPGDDPPLP